MRNPRVSKAGVNYYALLGVCSTATQDEITKAFRKKIIHVHLDKMGPEEDTEVCYLTIEAHRILSDKGLRAKYDVERTSCKDKGATDEVFIPAGYICYDVGHQQMSRQLLDRIANWTKEYDKCANELSDNYFDCFSQLMTQVMGDNEESEQSLYKNGENDNFSKAQKSRVQEHHYCGTCDKTFVTETHHWDAVIKSYRTLFFSDKHGIPGLISYFQELVGAKLFNWEPRYLPSRLLGIWASPDWSSVNSLHHEALTILKKCDYNPSSPDYMTTISKLDKFMDSAENNCVSFSTSHNTFIRRSLIQNLVWVLENKDHVEQMMSRMNELICGDDLQEILCLGTAMRTILSFQQSEWEQLIQDALKEEQYELAMLWTMLATESGDKCKGDFFQLGMTIRTSDPVLAHFCFLLSGCETAQSWEELANIFTHNGAHHAAIEYHLNKGNLFHLLHKSRALQNLDPDGASIYGGVYNATRIKGLLQVLSKRSRQCSSDASSIHNAELEELIEIVQDLTSSSNPLEGFRIIVSTWPDIFEESPGYWIHRATIQFLRRGRINLKSAKLILAAAHFLPLEERQDEILMVTQESAKLTRELLERALETNDFELVTDVMMHLSKRTLATAETYLAEINPPKTTPDEQNVDKEKNEKINDAENKSSESPQTNAPGHKSAMVLLVSGTVHKVKEEWFEAMTDYQNALLSAPECMHRVLPCVSKLVQDIQFHEAVVSKVHTEIEELQSRLVMGQYPDVDEFTSDKRRSLILTDVAPKMDYGYKDSVNKIQQDPDKMPGPPPEDEQDAPPPPPANTPMVTLDKNEEAIQSGQSEGQMDQLSAALAYVDLLKALPVPMHPGPIVMAASHFLRAMDDSPEDIGKLYAYRNAIMQMAENLLRVDRQLQATIHHGLTHKHMLSILLSSHEKLSKALSHAKNVDKKPDDEDDIEEKNIDKGKKTDLIRKSEASVISKFLTNVVNCPKVLPLASMPTLNCSDLVYVETLGNSFLSQFCADKVRQKHQSKLIPKHLHAYTHFVEVWKGRSTLADFPQARVKAMEELLALKGWCMGHIERKMSWPYLTLKDGFSPPVACLLQLRDPLRSYRSIDGFQINYKTGSISLLLSRDNMNPVDTLFDIYDIRDVVHLSRAGIMDKICFSLDSPDKDLSSHPFKEANVTLGKGHLTQSQQQKLWAQIPEFVQSTLSRVSLLLCFLASGVESSSETPFWMRRTDEGLLTRLDEHLQHLARPIPWRKAERRNDKKNPFEVDSANKFWLNMVEVFEEIEEDDRESGRHSETSILPNSQFTYRVGHMRTELRPHTMVMTLNPVNKKNSLGPEAEFAKDFTRHYREFGRAYPELLRIEELVKISIICSKLRQVLKENRALLQEQVKCDKNNTKLSENVTKVCSVIEEFLGIKQTVEEDEDANYQSCNWFPATFCHNMDPDGLDVSVGIELDPVVTYGPVSTSSKPIKLPLGNVVNPQLKNGYGYYYQVDDDFRNEVPLAQETVIHEAPAACQLETKRTPPVEEDSEEEDEEQSGEEESDSGEEVTDNDALSDVPDESEEELDEEEEGVKCLEEEEDDNCLEVDDDEKCVEEEDEDEVEGDDTESEVSINLSREDSKYYSDEMDKSKDFELDDSDGEVLEDEDENITDDDCSSDDNVNESEDEAEAGSNQSEESDIDDDDDLNESPEDPPEPVEIEVEGDEVVTIKVRRLSRVFTPESEDESVTNDNQVEEVKMSNESEEDDEQNDETDLEVKIETKEEDKGDEVEAPCEESEEEEMVSVNGDSVTSHEEYESLSPAPHSIASSPSLNEDGDPAEICENGLEEVKSETSNEEEDQDEEEASATEICTVNHNSTPSKDLTNDKVDSTATNNADKCLDESDKSTNKTLPTTKQNGSLHQDDKKSATSYRNRNVIDGKTAFQNLKKNFEIKSNSDNSAGVTKRSFLTRRSRLVEESNIICEPDEKKRADENEDKLILSQ